MQNVAVISSMQITPVLGSVELFVWPPAPSGCCTDCAATGDAAKRRPAINRSFFIEWLPPLAPDSSANPIGTIGQPAPR